MAGTVAVKRMAKHLEATTISEIAVMPLSMKKVDFLTVCLCIEHSIFREMVSGPFPFERIAGQAVGVLLNGRLFFFCDKENNFVVVARGYDATSNGVKTRVAPKLGQCLAGIAGALCNSGE